MESLVKGGLGNVWGRGVFIYNQDEIKFIGFFMYEWL